jgi:hypothetical protein
MSQENYAGSVAVSMLAGGTITRNALVALNSSGQVIVTTAITDPVFGVAQQDAASGEQVPVLTASGALVTLVASGAISTIGTMLMPTASGAGKVIAAAGATSLTCAQSITTAAASGDLILAILRPGVKSAANT